MAADKRHETLQARVLHSKGNANMTASSAANNSGKLLNLSNAIDKHLTGSLHGEFFEGTTSSNATRHKQLPEIFALRAEIEELKMAEQRRVKQGAAEKDEDEQAKKSAKLNANQTAAIENVVDMMCANKFRDLGLKIERLEDANEDLKKKNNDLNGELAVMKAKFKKGTPGLGAANDQVQGLLRKIATLEKDAKQNKTDQELLQSELITADSRLTGLEAKLTNTDARLQTVKSDHDWTRNHLELTKEMIQAQSQRVAACEEAQESLEELCAESFEPYSGEDEDEDGDEDEDEDEDEGSYSSSDEDSDYYQGNFRNW